jgi:hypothetical protein
MRTWIALLPLLLLVACGGSSDPRQSEVVKTLSGAWDMSTGGTMVFDFDENKVFVNNIPAEFTIDHVDGKTLYLKMAEVFQVRLIADNAAEWNVGAPNAIMLTREDSAPQSP